MSEPALEELGGRKRQTHHKRQTHKKNNVIVIGKVYADWCGHCQMLKPEWAKMKHHIRSKKGKGHVVFVEIEEKDIGTKLKKIEQEHGVTIHANGYPTLFRVSNGKVHYYNGQRQSHAMANWYLRGGDPEMPGVMLDQQGGRRNGFVRLHGTKRRNGFVRLHGTKRSRYHNNHFQRTRKQFSNKSPGILDLIFGK